MLFFEKRLNEVEKELHSLPHKMNELENTRKKSFKKEYEIKTNNLNDLGFKKEVISEGITCFTLDSKSFR
jgi:hypothetical protein